MTDVNKHDIEGNLVTAVVKALRAQQIPTTEMFSEDQKAGQRVQVRADMLGETGHEALDSVNQIIRDGYTLTLSLDIVTPLKSPDAHKSLRSLIRSKIAMPQGLAWINDHLRFASVWNLEVGGTQNEVMSGDEDFHEYVSSLTYTVHLAQCGI